MAPPDSGMPSNLADGAVSFPSFALVGTRTTLVDQKAAITFPAPAAAAAGDLLIAFWWVDGREENIVPPSAWEKHGSATFGFVGHVEVAGWIGSHLMLPGEQSTFTFTCELSIRHSVTVAAFRGARASQPVARAVLLPSVGVNDGGIVVPYPHTAPSFQVPDDSVYLFAFMTLGPYAFPQLLGFESIDATSSLGIYREPGIMSANSSVVPPTVSISNADPSLSTMGVATIALVPASR
jgi:hypothetical protein